MSDQWNASGDEKAWKLLEQTLVTACSLLRATWIPHDHFWELRGWRLAHDWD